LAYPKQICTAYFDHYYSDEQVQFLRLATLNALQFVVLALAGQMLDLPIFPQKIPRVTQAKRKIRWEDQHNYDNTIMVEY
jgi:hypothetical protein